MGKTAARNTTHHPSATVQEHHEGRYYNVPKRLDTETVRLQYLADELGQSKGEFTVTRKLASSSVVVRIGVDANSPGEASMVADEVVYAINWKRGVYRKDKGRKAPEEWALSYSDYTIVSSS